MCKVCVHNRQDGSCEAFPTGIPGDIYYEHKDHRLQVNGDGGVRFSVDPEADPDDIVSILATYT